MLLSRYPQFLTAFAIQRHVRTRSASRLNHRVAAIRHMNLRSVESSECSPQLPFRVTSLAVSTGKSKDKDSDRPTLPVVFIPGLYGQADEFSNKTNIQTKVELVTPTYVCVPIKYENGMVHPRFLEGVREMHSELNEKLTPPFVFASHSLGSVYALLYANMYPDEVAGIIGVESMGDLKFISKLTEVVKGMIQFEPFLDVLSDLERIPSFSGIQCPVILHENIVFSKNESNRILALAGVDTTPLNLFTLCVLLLHRHLYFVSLCARNPRSRVYTYKGKTHNLHFEIEDDVVASILSIASFRV